MDADSIDRLALRCSEETSKFNHREAGDARFCLELLRLALVENETTALTLMYQVYSPLVLKWVYGSSAFSYANESAEFFAHRALSQFYLALRGPRLLQFKSLAHILKYLHLCVQNTVIQYLREQQQVESLSDATEVSYMPDMEAEIRTAELWSHICTVLEDEEDRFLAHCAFAEDLKPADILRFFPGRWSSEREVSIALQRIRRALRRDPELRHWAGIEG